MTKRSLEPGDLIADPCGLKLTRILVPPDELKAVDCSNAFEWIRSGSDSERLLGPTRLKIMLVKDINIANNAFLFEDELVELANFEIGSYFPFLQSVNLASTCAGDAFIERLTTVAPSVTSVQLGACLNVTDSALVMIAARCPELTELCLSRCAKISDTGLVFLLERIGASLRALDLSFCELVTTATARAIAEHCTALEELKISNTAINAAGVEEILRASSMPNLASLSVANCAGFDSTILTLALRRFPRLRTLDVSFCFELKENEIVSALKRNKRVQIRAFGLDFECADDLATDVRARLEF